MEKIKRIYSISDANMLVYAKVVHAHLRNDLALFNELDSTFTEASLDTIGVQINLAEAQLPNEVLNDEQVIKTESTEEIMQRARKHWQKFKYFITQKTYPNDVARQNKFGLDNYKNARRSQAEMLIFLKTLAGVSREHEAELLASGMSATLIADSMNIWEALDKNNIEQEMFKGDKGVQTQDRIKDLNLLFTYIRTVRESAKIVFDGDAANMKRYLYQRRNTTSNDESPEKFMVAGNTKTAIVKSNITESSVFEIENIGSVSLSFYVGENTEDETPSNAKTIRAGEKISMMTSDIQTDEDVLAMFIASNTNTEEGSFLLSVFE